MVQCSVIGLAEITSVIGNGASSVGEDVMLVQIQKRSLEENEEDVVVVDVNVGADIELEATEKIHSCKAARYDREVLKTQSWKMSSVTRTPHSKSSLSLESLELANVAKEAMGSLARNIMEGGVGMFELLLEKQQQL